MKSTKSGSRTSRSSKLIPRQSSLTSKHQSIETFPSPKQKKADKKLEDKFINSHSQLRSQKSSKRLIAKLERFKEVREPAPLYIGNKKKLRAKSQADAESILSTLEHSVKPKRRHTLKRLINDGKKHLDLNQKPDIECIKEVLSRITPKQATHKITSSNLNLIEKTKLLVKHKTEKQSQETKLKQEPQHNSANTNPPASKSKNLHKKSKSDSNLPVKPIKTSSSESDPNNILIKQIRASAPNKSHKRVLSYLPAKGTFISSTLGKLSPGKAPGKEEISAKMLQLCQKLT